MEQLEQMMQIYHAVYLGCLAAAVLFLIITVILFLHWRIWEAVGILTGRAAEKAVSNGKIQTEKKKSKKKKQMPEPVEVTTEKLWYREAQTEPPIGAGQGTMVLASSNSTVVLQPDTSGTVVLDGSNGQNFGKTEYLDGKQESGQMWEMQILDEMIEVHSQERM